MVENVLKVLAGKFDNEECKVDKTTFNPARITKLYGTLACKGDSTPDRPHRVSSLVHVPEAMGTVSREQLTALIADLSPVDANSKTTTTSTKAGRNGHFDVEDFFREHGVGVKRIKTKSNGTTMFELENCPFNPDHGDHGEVAVFKDVGGKLGFKCHHDGCSGRDWRAFREHYDPGCYDRHIVGSGGREDANSTLDSSGLRRMEPADALQTALADDRPKVRLPGPNRLLSDFATELADIVGDNLFVRNDEVVILDNGELKPMTPAEFRTWTEQFFCGYKVKGEDRKAPIEFNVTMTNDDSAGVLASPQFREKLRPIRQVNDCRLPVIRADRTLQLLPMGYDAETETLTLPTVEYNPDMTMEDAVATIEDLFSEFVFPDGQRSKAVAISGMVGLYGKHLLPRLTLRPCFLFVANAEGAGKSMLVTTITTPTLGRVPTGGKARDDDEIKKLLLTTIREARPVLFLDNLKGHLSSPSLEAFISAPDVEDRKLGVNEFITGENLTTVFITGNGLTVSPDMRRRSLFVELRLEVERAEDRQFRRPLDVPTLLAMRPKVLEALWSLVRNWDRKGRPLPSRSHSAFPSWGKLIGGIVEAGGFGCPLETAEVAVVADEDGDDMRRLVQEMKDKNKMMFSELVDVARRLELFEGIIPAEDEKAGNNKWKATLSSLLKRYEGRLVADRRFIIQGKKRNRRFWVEYLNQWDGETVGMVLCPENGKNTSPGNVRNTVSHRPTVPPPTNTNVSLYDARRTRTGC